MKNLIWNLILLASQQFNELNGFQILEKFKKLNKISFSFITFNSSNELSFNLFIL